MIAFPIAWPDASVVTTPPRLGTFLEFPRGQKPIRLTS
jgi:hypothetical protein